MTKRKEINILLSFMNVLVFNSNKSIRKCFTEQSRKQHKTLSSERQYDKYLFYFQTLKSDSFRFSNSIDHAENYQIG